MCVFIISPVPITEPLTSEFIDTPVFHNLAPRPIKYRVSVPIPRHKGPGSLVMMLLWATILSTIFIKGTQIDTKRQEPGAVAEHAGGHLHARVQRQTLTHSLSLFQRSLSPSTHHWSPSGTNTVSSLSVSRLYTSACDTNLRPASWSACVVVTVSRVSLKSIQMYYSHVL